MCTRPYRPLATLSLRATLLLGATLALSACTTPPPPASTSSVPALALPERSSGWTPQPAGHFQRHAVAAAHPLAAEAGLQMLRAGGSALDAAIAAQLVLNVVEPQSSGIGGGAMLMLWSGREMQAWDGRETAPAAADERLFLRADGQPLAPLEAVVGGRAVGVPGAVRMLEAAHRQHGSLPWAALFQPAIALAQQGAVIGPRLHRMLQADAALRRDPLARAHFYAADGSPHPIGQRLPNPALAAVLRAIATGGSDALHRGTVAADLVRRVQQHAANPGRMTADDLAAYRERQRQPLCTPWREVYRICGFPPPSSGHLALMQILGVLERLPAAAPAASAAGSDTALHRYAEAARLAFADRALFVADPDFVAAPAGDWNSLLAPAYLARQATRIGERSLGIAAAGQPGPAGAAVSNWAPMAEQPAQGTSHISVVDDQGRAVALTTSIEAQFGARLMSDGGTGLPGGFLLNNQLTDFSLTPADAQGRAVANRVQPGKRPRSSMSPTLVFDQRDGRLLMTLGSALGPVIIHAVAKSLLATLHDGQDLQAAFDRPQMANLNGPTLLEAGRFDAATLAALRARGHTVVEVELPTGLHGLQRSAGGGWLGAADPRREGAVRGD
jgi:gamma-glutamyltranspeptidase/glutathione hydrolase